MSDQRPLEKLLSELRQEANEKRPVVTGAELAALVEIAEAARDLLTIGLRNNGERLCVVESDDNTDPHYRLCDAVEKLEKL